MAKQIVTDKNIEEFAGQLGDPIVYGQVAFVVEFLTESPSTGECYRFLNKLETALNKNQLNEEMNGKYNHLVIRLKYAALPILELSDLSDLFKRNLLYAFINGIDIVDRTKRLFPTDQASTEYLTTKSGLLQAIEGNTETLGNDTVGNWIRSYKKAIGEKNPGTLEVVSFITENPAALQLDSNSKQLLKLLLYFYDWLKYKSVDTAEVLSMNRKPIWQPPVSAPYIDIPRPPMQAAASDQGPSVPEAPRATEELKEMTAFEKKLAEISSSVPQTHGADLEVLKHRLEDSSIQSPAGGTPNLDNAVNTEIKREVATPELPASQPNLNNPINSEIKREVATAELTPHLAPKPTPPKPVPPAPRPVPPPMRPVPPAPRPAPPAPKPTPPPRPVIPTPPTRTMFLASLDKISSLEDLKKVEPGHLRQGPIATQIGLIKSNIISVVKSNRIIPYYAVLAFEQSPLFKTYLKIGSLMIEDVGADRDTAFRDAAKQLGNNLTLDEFEAVADLRKSLEQL